MPVSGTSTKLIQQIEDDTAICLAGRDSLLVIELAIRALHRRGYINDDDLRRLEAELDTASKAVRHKLDYARHLRQHPQEAIGD